MRKIELEVGPRLNGLVVIWTIIAIVLFATGTI